VSSLSECCEFRPGLLRQLEIGIGVLPERQEVLIRHPGLPGVPACVSARPSCSRATAPMRAVPEALIQGFQIAFLEGDTAEMDRLVALARGKPEVDDTVQKHSTPLEEATTPSLEALKAYSAALKSMNDAHTALPLLKRALEIDPNFATAHAQLALLYSGIGESLLGEKSMSKAYELRDRANRWPSRAPRLGSLERFDGQKGNPDVWVARSANVIVRPLLEPIVTVAGKYFATGSVNFTSPRRAISASRADVNTLVTEPISKTVSPVSARDSSWLNRPYGMIRRPPGVTMPTTIPTLRR